MIMWLLESAACPCLLQGAALGWWWAPQTQLNLPRGQIFESPTHVSPQDGFAGHFRERWRPGASAAALTDSGWKMARSSQHSSDTGARCCVSPGWGRGWGKLLLQPPKVLFTGPIPLAGVAAWELVHPSQAGDPCLQSQGEGVTLTPLTETAFLPLAGAALLMKWQCQVKSLPPPSRALLPGFLRECAKAETAFQTEWMLMAHNAYCETRAVSDSVTFDSYTQLSVIPHA